MPRLIRGIARTAAIAGTATAVSNRVSRRQAGRWASQDAEAQQQAPVEQQAPVQQAAPEPTRLTTDQKIAQLKQLGELKQAGVLSDAEFEVQKHDILNS